jgi:hypothetical protein
MTKTKLTIVLLLVMATAAAGRQGPPPQVLPDNWFDNYVEVTGKGAPLPSAPPKSAQAYLTAERAAVVLANRNAAEIVSGITIAGDTEVNDTAFKDEQVRQRVAARIRAGQLVKETSRDEFSSLEYVEATLRFPLTGTGSILSAILPTMRADIVKKIDAGIASKTYIVYTPLPAPVAPAAPPRGPAPPAPTTPAVEYDGLILQVPSTIDPCIAPKIYTEKGELLYSAKDVAADVFVSRGAAQYTNNEGKAKTALDGMGAKQVLVIQASSHSGNSTDVDVKAADAAKVFSSNKLTAFLSKGRIVFLVSKS